VREALKNNAWIFKINPTTVISTKHICQLFTLWDLVHEFQLDENAEDTILWKHTTSGHYSAASAYKAQFFDLVLSPMNHMFGSIGHRQKPKSFLGWPSKIEFGPLIGLLNEGRQTVGFAPFAEGNKTVGHTYSTNVGCPNVFGIYSLTNYILRTWTFYLALGGFHGGLVGKTYRHRHTSS
jgi:hypothetical protein